MLVLYSPTAFAQYFTGASMGSYSGVNSLIVNPAFMTNSRYYLDVNLVGAGSFFHNNYAYLAREDYDFFRMLKPDFNFPMHDKQYGDGERPAYTLETVNTKNLLFDNRILGPSALFGYNDHFFALQTSFRSVSSFRNVPYDMANYLYYSLDYSPQHGREFEHLDPMRAGSISWTEIGFSWAYAVSKYDRDHWSIGVSAKMLLGHAAYYVYLEHLKYFVPDDENLYIRNVRGDVAYSFPVDYDNNELYNGSLVKGIGLGLDIGISYTHTIEGHSRSNHRKPCQGRFMDYKYRIGLSLMDFGSINFNDVARKYRLEDYDGVWHQIDTLGPYYTNLNYISNDISEHLCGGPDCAQVANRFRVVLPATLGAQFDYHIREYWYLSATARVPLNYTRNQVSSAYSLMVVPRMETHSFEFGVPVTMYNLLRPLMGAYVRLYNVTVGTDNIGGFLSLTDHFGYNVYFSVKLNILRGKCKRKMPRFCTGDEYRFRTPSRKR